MTAPKSYFGTFHTQLYERDGCLNSWSEMMTQLPITPYAWASLTWPNLTQLSATQLEFHPWYQIVRIVTSWDHNQSWGRTNATKHQEKVGNVSRGSV
jgi:hypothetical protein